MAKKPAGLIYGVDDKPPLAISALLGLQHVVVMTAGWIMVVVIVTTIGGTPIQVENVLRMSMIASGIATILQSLANSTVGSGYFCPISSGPAYISASMVAGKIGGLPLISAMTMASGIFEGLLSRVLPRLRPLFPPEVTGLVVTMVGVELITLGCPRFLGFQDGSGPDGISSAIGVLTLSAMIAPTIWGKGKLKLYPLLIGLAVGCVLAYFLGAFQEDRLKTMFDAPMFSLPRRAEPGFLFQADMLPAFLIASLASALKSVGDLTLCQKMNDAEWKRTDMKSVSGGMLAGAIGTGLSGLLGGIGQSTFSSNVGLALATGATSRFIAIPTGILMILLAFLPKLAAFFAVMPDPVMGSILVYVACYMILAGIQVITSRMLDSRRIFVVGVALIFGLSVDMVPGLFRDVPHHFQPLVSSSLAVSTVLVVVLNLLFRIGVTKHHKLELTPGVGGSDEVFQALETQGGVWGARRDVVMRAASALNEFLESLAGLGFAKGKAKADITFDEFNLDVDIRYEGELMDFPSRRPTEDVFLSDNKGVATFSGYLIRQYVDSITSESAGGQCHVRMHFDH
jgi:NCS2 family nucleobase:cation symporter-2